MRDSSEGVLQPPSGMLPLLMRDLIELASPTTVE